MKNRKFIQRHFAISAHSITVILQLPEFEDVWIHRWPAALWTFVSPYLVEGYSKKLFFKIDFLSCTLQSSNPLYLFISYFLLSHAPCLIVKKENQLNLFPHEVCSLGNKSTNWHDKFAVTNVYFVSMKILCSIYVSNFSMLCDFLPFIN